MKTLKQILVATAATALLTTGAAVPAQAASQHALKPTGTFCNIFPMWYGCDW